MFLIRPSVSENPLALVVRYQDLTKTIRIFKRPNNQFALGSLKTDEMVIKSHSIFIDKLREFPILSEIRHNY